MTRRPGAVENSGLGSGPGQWKNRGMRKLIICLLAVVGCLLAACTPTPTETTEPTRTPSDSTTSAAPTSEAPEPPEGSRFALMLVDASAAGSVQLLNAAIEKADDVGAEIASFDAQGDEERLPDLVASAIEAGFDAVLVEPLYWNGLEGVAKKAKEEGVPFVLVGRQADAVGDASSYVGPDPGELARVQMNGVVGLLEGEGRIGILTVVPRTPFYYAFEEGYDEVLWENTGVEVVLTQAASGSPSQAADDVRGWLDRLEDPELDLIVAQNDLMADAAREVLAEEGRDDIGVVGIGTTDATLNALLDGAVGGTVWTSQYEVGVRAVEVAAALVQGEPVEANSFVPGAEWVDATNVNQYLME